MNDWMKLFALWFDKDEGAGAGGGDADPDKTDDGPGSDEDAEKSGDEEVTFSPAQQAYIDKLIGRTRVKEREKAKATAEAEAAKKAKEAEEKALQDQEEWKTLAENRAKEIADLTTKNATLEEMRQAAERFEQTLNNILDKQKKDLPAHILPLIEKMDPVDAMNYISENAEALNVKPDVYTKTPKPSEKKVTSEDENAAQKASRSVVTRNF